MINSRSLKFVIISVIFTLFSFGNTKSINSDEIKENAEPPGPVGRFGPGSSSSDYYDRKAREAYEKRNAEIIPLVESNMSLRPDNAALLYYQAFLLRPEPDESIKYKLYLGTEINTQIRTYLGHCLPTIEIAEMASQIPQCTWGLWPNYDPSRIALRRNLGSLHDILLVDAQALAADGHYRVALERCLTIRQLARHLSEDSELYIYSIGINDHALDGIRHILSVMPPDTDILTWLRGQLAVVQGAPPYFAKQLQAYINDELNHIRMDPDYIARLRNLLLENAKDKNTKESIRNLTDEQIFIQVRDGLQHIMASIFQILDSDMTYENKLAEMQMLVSKLLEDDNTNPAVKDIISINNMHMQGVIDLWYPTQIRHEAHINSIKVAVEVYLVVAKTGQLPDKLPAHLPKDPFSGENFGYDISDEGFALRYQYKDFQRYKKWFEFKVQK